MATEVRSAVCKNTGELKEFLRHLSDKMPIKGGFDEPVKFTVWRRDPHESGPKMHPGWTRNKNDA
jgi:hypothetical protein